MGGKSDGGTSETAPKIVQPGTPDVPMVSGTRFNDILSVADQKALNAIGSVDTLRDADMPIFREGDRQILSFLWPGDIFGLVGDDGLYMNSAATVSAAKIHRFPLNRLESMLLRNPQLQCHLLIKVNHDLRAAQRQIIALGQSDTCRRLASFLVEMMQHPALAEPECRQFRLPMARRDIADYLGTTPESVSRGFKRLEREGIVRRVSPRVLEFEDLPGLSRLARR